VPAPELLLVQTAADLQRAADRLADVPRMAVDAEMSGLFTFRARVCLLQIATEGVEVIVDTLAVPDLGPLVARLSASGTTRFLHGAAHDVKCLKRDFGIELGGLFDTYVAAQLLDLPKLGYADVVSARFGQTLPKAFQTSDWRRRPLSAAQLDYLRGDVRWLLPLGVQLEQELGARGLSEEAGYEFARVAALPPEDERLPDDAWLRPREARDLSPPSQAALRELFLVRDELARSLDRPAFKVVGNEVLLDIARRRLADVDAIAAVRGMPRGPLGARLAEALSPAVQRGLAAGAPPPPASTGLPRPGREEIRARRTREEKLREWRKKTAAGRGVPPMVVLPAYSLEELVRTAPATVDELARLPGMIPKRLRLYGEDLLRVIANRAPASSLPPP